MVDRRRRLGVDQEAHLFAHGRAAPRGSFGLLSGLLVHRRTRRFLRHLFSGLSLGRRRNGLGLDHRRRRGLSRISVEIGHRIGCFRSRCRPEFVRDRSGQAVFQLGTTPAASAATAATARAPLAIGRLIAAGHAGLFVAFILVGFAVLGDRAFDGLARDAYGLTILARGGAITRLATAASASASLAAVNSSGKFCQTCMAPMILESADEKYSGRRK